jgi:hypothetical protein
MVWSNDMPMENDTLDFMKDDTPDYSELYYQKRQEFLKMKEQEEAKAKEPTTPAVEIEKPKTEQDDWRENFDQKAMAVDPKHYEENKDPVKFMKQVTNAPAAFWNQGMEEMAGYTSAFAAMAMNENASPEQVEAEYSKYRNAIPGMEMYELKQRAKDYQKRVEAEGWAMPYIDAEVREVNRWYAENGGNKRALPWLAATADIRSAKFDIDPEAEGLIMDVASGAASLVASIVEGVTGPAAPALTSIRIFGRKHEAIYKELKRKFPEMEDGKVQDRAFQAALAGAGAEAALERIGVAGTLFKKAGIKGLQKMFKHYFVKGVASEGLTELLQEYPDQIIFLWATNPELDAEQLQDLVKEKLPEMTKDAAYSGLIGGILGGGVSVATGTWQSAHDKYKVMTPEDRQAEINKQKFIDDETDISTPEGRQAFIDSIPDELYNSRMKVTPRTPEQVQAQINQQDPDSYQEGSQVEYDLSTPEGRQAFIDDTSIDGKAELRVRSDEMPGTDMSYDLSTPAGRQRFINAQPDHMFENDGRFRPIYERVKKYTDEQAKAEPQEAKKTSPIKEDPTPEQQESEARRRFANELSRVDNIPKEQARYAFGIIERIGSTAVRRGYVKNIDEFYDFWFSKLQQSKTPMEGDAGVFEQKIAGAPSTRDFEFDVRENIRKQNPGITEQELNETVAAWHKAKTKFHLYDKDATTQNVSFTPQQMKQKGYTRIADGKWKKLQTVENAREKNIRDNYGTKKKRPNYWIKLFEKHFQNEGITNTEEFINKFKEYTNYGHDRSDRTVTSKLNEQEVVRWMYEMKDRYGWNYPPTMFFKRHTGYNQGTKAQVNNLFTDLPKVITLFENSDISSIVHETGHILLDMMETYGDDSLSVAAEFVGADPNTSAKDWTREQNETFAKGFEKYLMEGKAPSKGLMKLFEKMKSWLTSIYAKTADTYFRGPDGKKINIKPEVKQMFDRWLTQDMIKTKTQEMSNGNETIDISCVLVFIIS